MRLFILILSSLFFLHSAQAQDLPIKRVLVLHGVWTHDNWEVAIDNSLANLFAQSSDFNIEMSSRYLGLDTDLSPESLAGLKVDIARSVREQSIDLIIGVLPSANDFLYSLELPLEITQIRVLPDPDNATAQINKDNIIIVLSAAEDIIRKTLSQIVQLRPQAQEISVIAGVSRTDSVYLERTRNIASTMQLPFELNYFVGDSPSTLLEKLSQLPRESAALLLPYEAYGEAFNPVPIGFSENIATASAVPVFGLYDSELGSGVVGGHLSTTSSYTRDVVEYALAAMSGSPISNPVIESTGTTIYDWRQIERWKLPIDRLSTPYELRYQPNSLWEDRPQLVIILVNIFLLLVVFIVVQYVLLVRSISAQREIKQANSLAVENESKYRFLADNSLDTIWLWNELTERLEFCSPSVLKLTGFEASDVQQQKFSVLMDDESSRIFKQTLQRDERESAVFEIQIVAKHGQKIWCEIAAQLSDDNSSNNQWVCVCRDVSVRKHIQQERLALEEHVRQSQKFDSLGTLAGGIAHDMNNILGVIVGSTDLLKSEKNSGKNREKLLTKITHASSAAKSLVTQILTFSKESAGDTEIVDVKESVNQTLDILRSGIPKCINLEFKIDAEDSSILVTANKTRIEQLIINLATNAYEAITEEQGSIQVELKTLNTTAPMLCQHGKLPAGSYVVLSVQDDGSGMNQGELNRIFEPFYTSKELGNGLGLAIVYGVVMEIGGAINVESIEGSGTCFQIYLPRMQPTTQSMAKEEATAFAGSINELLEGKTIAIVDDQEDMRKILSMMLQHLGHDCQTYSRAIEALENFRSSETLPDLVITDYSMPEMSGIQFAEICSAEFPALPIILSSGYGDRITEEHPNQHQSIRTTLHKPFDLQSLNKALIAVLQTGKQIATSQHQSPTKTST